MIQSKSNQKLTGARTRIGLGSAGYLFSLRAKYCKYTGLDRFTLKGGGGGQTFFRAFINSELGLPEVAPCMARTFGGVSGHR